MMKKLVLVWAVLGGISLSAAAQTEKTPKVEKKPQVESQKEVRNPSEQPIQMETVRKAPPTREIQVRKVEVESTEAKKPAKLSEKPSEVQKETKAVNKRAHAEEKSKGNAFSGKGKGGDKNLVDPEKKEKKTKKAKKLKKAKKVK